MDLPLLFISIWLLGLFHQEYNNNLSNKVLCSAVATPQIKKTSKIHKRPNFIITQKNSDRKSIIFQQNREEIRQNIKIVIDAINQKYNSMILINGLCTNQGRKYIDKIMKRMNNLNPFFYYDSLDIYEDERYYRTDDAFALMKSGEKYYLDFRILKSSGQVDKIFLMSSL